MCSKIIHFYIILNVFICRSQFKHFSYEFYVRLYGFIIDKSITHRHNYEGFQIKAEKLYKTGIYFIIYRLVVS